MTVTEATAIAGAVGTLALLVLNLKVSSEVNGVKIEMANLRAEIRKETSDHYADTMRHMTSLVESLTKMFANREATDAKHQANLDRLDGIELSIRELVTRVQDIG
jgi:hypothetical protein